MSKIELGPVFGSQLIDSLPLGGGGMFHQAMPNRRDLVEVRKVSERTAAGYEVLLSQYKKQVDEVARLKGLIRDVIAGNWSITDLQESIGDI